MYNNNIEREITGQAKYSIADMCNTRDKTLPFFHRSTHKDRTTRKAREARRPFEWHEALIHAAEPISPTPATYWRAPRDESGDGRRKTTDDYDAKAAFAASNEVPTQHDLDREAAIAHRRKVDASIVPTPHPERTQEPEDVSTRPDAAGYRPGSYTLRSAAPQFDPWRSESVFLARVFHGEHAERVGAATTAALCGVPAWMTESIFSELVCDGAKPEAVARRVGVTGKTVRAHIKRATEQFRAYYTKANDPTFPRGSLQPGRKEHTSPPTVAFTSNETRDDGPTVAYRQAKDDAIINEMLREQAERLCCAD